GGGAPGEAAHADGADLGIGGVAGRGDRVVAVVEADREVARRGGAAVLDGEVEVDRGAGAGSTGLDDVERRHDEVDLGRGRAGCEEREEQQEAVETLRHESAGAGWGQKPEDYSRRRRRAGGR